MTEYLESVLARPTTKHEILGNREIIFVETLPDIIKAHETRTPDQTVIISPKVELIPGVYYSAQNFTKRGPLVQIPTYTETGMVRMQWSDLKARIEASKRYENRKNEGFVGWVWFDPEKVAHVLHPTTVIEGHRLFMASYKSSNIHEKIELREEDYNARDSNLRTIKALVPSRFGEEKKHSILLEHLTELDDPKRFAEWTRIRSRHECPLKSFDFSFRFKNYQTYCPHDIAAHTAYTVRRGEEKKVVVPQPFPLVSEPMLRLHIGLVHNTMKTQVTLKDGRPTMSYIPLNFAEMNKIEMYAWLDKGNRITFYLHSLTKGYKRMRDFDWSAGAGMPFKDPQV